MRGACSAMKMGLFLHAVGSISPTESPAEGSLIHCEGVNNQSYFCEYGHCCGESQCCSYYYELWWFWLVWAIIFILCFCCICHHRRTKHRLQQQQRQHEINLIAYREAHNYPAVPFYFRFLPNYLLPDYEEVVNRPPTPPPPYSALNMNSSSAASVPMAPDQQAGLCPSLQSPPAPPVSDGPCSRPAADNPQPPTFDLRPKPDNKPLQTAPDSSLILVSDGLNEEKKTDSCKDPLLSEGGADDKERLPHGRRRRFTGDSGIEVCVCGTRGSSDGGAGGPGKDGKERESLLGRSRDNEEEEEEEEGGDFCDSCGHRASLTLEEEPALGGGERRAGRGTPQNVCLLLHTISEQDGPAHSTDPQG